MHYKSKWVETLLLSAGFFIAELSHAKRGSGVPWVRKWGNLPYTDWPTAQATVRPQEYLCKITQSTGMATQMQLEVILAGNRIATILGDPGAVSRVGRKGRTKVFKYGRKSPWVPTLTELFPKIQADAGSWLGTKNALYYCAQSANSFSWVLFVSSYTTAIVSPHLPGSFTKLVRTRETFIFYFPNQKRRNYRWVERTFGMLSAGAIEFAPRIFCFWRITMYRK